jgi:hypothetical protein
VKRAALKPDAPERFFWVGRCQCGSARSAVEVGEGDDYSRRELSEFFGYVVEREPGPVKFQAHIEGCAGKVVGR